MSTFTSEAAAAPTEEDRRPYKEEAEAATEFPEGLSAVHQDNLEQESNALREAVARIFPPNPEDERARLMELRKQHILDTDYEEAFDRITTLAARLFNVPIAIVSLVDKHRQWFKSCVGLAARETPRCDAFCAWAILPKKPECLVVPDATKDERFWLNPLVLGPPSIRFYAGAPLVTSNNYKLGTLCIIDSQPRTMSEAEIQTLTDLAAIVMQAMELRLKNMYSTLECEIVNKDKERLLYGVNCLSEGLIMWDACTQGIVFVNRGFERITGYSLGDVKDKTLEVLEGEETAESAKQTLRAALISAENTEVEMLHYRKNGSKFWSMLRITPVTHFNNTVTSYVGVLSDITERKEAELELKRAKKAAEAATKAKSMFLANMSHEIRTPLNAVIASAEMLFETKPTTEQEDLIYMMYRSSHILLSLVDKVLDFSKIEAESVELKPIHFDLWECIKVVINMLSLKASMKNLCLCYNIAENVPRVLFADENRVIQVLSNLLNNAITFTAQGDVRLEVTAKLLTAECKPPPKQMRPQADSGEKDAFITLNGKGEQATSKHMNEKGVDKINEQGNHGLEERHHDDDTGGYNLYEIAFEVQDTGTGIQERHIKDLFQAFRQVDSKITRKVGGTGLGLAICRRLAQLMGGDTWVKSEYGKGSVFGFTIRVPCWISDKPAPASLYGSMLLSYAGTPKPLLSARLHGGQTKKLDPSNGGCTANPSMPPLRILVAEDNKINQKVICRMLHSLSYRPHVVENGLEALQEVKNKHYDVVLMDLHMPVMDGLEASKRIQTEVPPEKRPYIVAVTADVVAGIQQKCKDAGMVGYISKPIEKRQVASILLQVANTYVTQS
ncbi:putative mitogen-activated protein kinase kinase kinase 11 at C-terminar half [Balamuthia mandrillaris]